MPCLHPITVDLQLLVWWRSCALCALSYNRTLKVLTPLRKQCEAAWKINFTKFPLNSDDAQEIAG